MTSIELRLTRLKVRSRSLYSSLLFILKDNGYPFRSWGWMVDRYLGMYGINTLPYVFWQEYWTRLPPGAVKDGSSYTY